MVRWLVVLVALSSEAWGFCTPTVRQQLSQPIRRRRAMRIAVVPTAALDVGGFGLDDPKALAAAVGVAAAGVAAYVSRSNTAAQVPALRWDDNARWLETCKAKGVVSWYDAGLRLTAS